MQKQMIVGVVLYALFHAGAISASPFPFGYWQAEFVDRGARVAQNTSLPEIAPSALRRLTFYSDKALLALFDLVNEDLVSGSGGAAISIETTDAFRSAIERLIDAGGKADLDVDQTAVFFGQEVAVRFSGPVPLLLQGSGGEIDPRDLFRGVAANKAATRAQPAVDSAYMEALVNESQSMQAVAEEPQAEPVVDENIDPTFAERIVMVDGKRTITVEPGDSLAIYANAFYGDSLLYRTIYLANTQILRNPNVLEVGQVVIIPDI